MFCLFLASFSQFFKRKIPSYGYIFLIPPCSAKPLIFLKALRNGRGDSNVRPDGVGRGGGRTGSARGCRLGSLRRLTLLFPGAAQLLPLGMVVGPTMRTERIVVLALDNLTLILHRSLLDEVVGCKPL